MRTVEGVSSGVFRLVGRQFLTLCWVSVRGRPYYSKSRLGLIDRDFQLFRIYIVMLAHKHITYFQLRTYQCTKYLLSALEAFQNTLFAV